MIVLSLVRMKFVSVLWLAKNYMTKENERNILKSLKNQRGLSESSKEYPLSNYRICHTF